MISYALFFLKKKSVGDVFFQQRCMRRIQQIKRAGVTIVFVSHELDAVRNLAESSTLMEHRRVALEGKTDEVVAKYLSAIVFFLMIRLPPKSTLFPYTTLFLFF